jgi:ligand-binding SRPBCC domain-containing protein
MNVSLSTRIATPPNEVWQRVQTPELMMHIAAPLVRFELLEPSQASDFGASDRFLVKLTLFGFLPFGTQWIVPTVHVDDTAPWPKRLRDNGHSALIRTWDHWITVEPDDDGGTRYRDEVEVKAGLLTPFIWAFAHIFYRHRQRRWRALAKDIQKGLKHDAIA